MKITSITVDNYGPFSTPTTIDFDQYLTIFTGPNDTGKTSALKLLDLIWVKNKFSSPEDANYDRLINSNTPWDEDITSSCRTTIKVDSITQKFFSNVNLQNESELIIENHFAPKVNLKSIIRVSKDGRIDSSNILGHLNKIPRVLWFPNATSQIKSTIDLSSPNEMELNLLNLAFGQNPLRKIQNLNSWQTKQIFVNASELFNEQFKKIIPNRLDYQIEFSICSDNKKALNILFIDKQKGIAPISIRGEGIKKLLSLACLLLENDSENQFTYILLDEPENSLHADAQHSFRNFLYELGKQDRYQVIYSTHSPAMLNTFRSEQFRLFSREIVNGIPTTVVDNHPVGDNYSKIKMSLGISPADSLLIGKYTIITEGSTEVLNLPILFELITKEIPEYGNLIEILPDILLIDATGDSFEYWCSIVQKQNGNPILFVDGDKIKKVKKSQAKGKLEGIQIITLDDGKEFEDLIPIEDYFIGLNDEIEGNPVSLEEFRKWQLENPKSKTKMISKQIQEWLHESIPDIYFDKARTMKLALQKCDIEKINLQPIIELIGKLK